MVPKQTDTNREAPGGATGALLVQLIFGSRHWIHLREDTLLMDSSGVDSWTSTLHLTVPAEIYIKAPGGDILIPLSLVEERSVRNLQVKDEAGELLPVLSTSEAAPLAFEFVLELIPMPLRSTMGFSSTLIPRLRTAFMERAMPLSEVSEHVLLWLDELSDRDVAPYETQLAMFRQLSVNLTQSSILFVVADDTYVGRRRVLQFSYKTNSSIRAKGRRDLRFGAYIPDYGQSPTYIFTVQVPEQLVLMSLNAREVVAGGNQIVTADKSLKLPGVSAGMSLAPLSRISAGYLEGWLRPAPQGIFGFTVTAVFVLAFVVILSSLERIEFVDFLSQSIPEDSPAVSILLSGPALLLSWISRRPEHPLAVTTLGPLRNMLTLCAIAFFLLAVLVSLPLKVSVWNAMWFAICGLTFWLVLRLCVYTFHGRSDVGNSL